jgi:hypothetical protein
MNTNLVATHDNTNTEITQGSIHASIGIRTHDPSVLVGKDVFRALDRAATVICIEITYWS